MLTAEEFWPKFWTKEKTQEAITKGWLVNNTMPIHFAQAYGDYVLDNLPVIK